MSKTITIKLTKAGPNSGPFKIIDQFGNVIAENVSKGTLIRGISYIVDDDINIITLESTGKCKSSINITVSDISIYDYVNSTYTQTSTGCIWRHLTDIQVYNYFYGEIHPYVIEYPFAYQYQDEILQNVKDFTRAYQYLPIPDGVFNDNSSIEVNGYFNKAILYNGQQCTGLLKLAPKPMNNLHEYMKYPIYDVDSKTITYTKSDNFYQYNTFWSLLKDKKAPIFLTSCESLSVDKILNQANMDYGKRSFKKEPLRAKFLKVRHILDNRSDLHLVSGFIVSPAQISYK